MKQGLLITSLMAMAMLMPSGAWADVEINETNFPDANFRAVLIALPEGKDGVFTDEEIAGLHTIVCSLRCLPFPRHATAKTTCP